MATPTPVAPPPTTIMSQALGCASMLRHMLMRFMASSLDGLFCGWTSQSIHHRGHREHRGTQGKPESSLRRSRSPHTDLFDNGSGNAAGDQRADDRYERVSPIGTPLAADGQDRVSHARAKVTGGIDRVSGRSAETQADDPHQDSPQPRAEANRKAGG